MLCASDAVESLWLHGELLEQSFEALLVLNQVLFLIAELLSRRLRWLLKLWSLLVLKSFVHHFWLEFMLIAYLFENMNLKKSLF